MRAYALSEAHARDGRKRITTRGWPYTSYVNVARVHQTLRVTPAMAAGLAEHVFEHRGNRRPLGQTASSGSVRERNDDRQAGRIVDGLRV
jgi:hypothetical protein